MLLQLCGGSGMRRLIQCVFGKVPHSLVAASSIKVALYPVYLYRSVVLVVHMLVRIAIMQFNSIHIYIAPEKPLGNRGT